MSETNQIDEYNNAFQSAMQTGDVEACVALCTEDAILMPPEEAPVRGREAIARHFSGLGADASVQATVIELNVSGDLACQHSQVSWNGDDGPRYTDSLDVLQKQSDGRWLLLASSWNTSSGFQK